MIRSFAPAGVVCALAGCCFSHAQDLQTYQPLTLGEQYRFTLNKTVSPGALGLVLFKSLFDQMRDQPHQWGANADSFTVRAASHFGRSLLRQNIAFGIRAADGEDPRYFRSGQGGKWTRTRYALAHTFSVHDARGGWMPAYSLFVSSYATPFLANEWRPDRRTVPCELRAGTMSIGIQALSNLMQEFGPDIKNKIRHPR